MLTRILFKNSRVISRPEGRPPRGHQGLPLFHLLARRFSMAVNKPVGDNARKGAVRKRSQIKIKLIGKDAWVKRNKKGGKFTSVKKARRSLRASGGRRRPLRSRTHKFS